MKQGQISTCGVGHEGTETNFVKSPPLVAHVLMSKKRRYFLFLKHKKETVSVEFKHTVNLNQLLVQCSCTYNNVQDMPVLSLHVVMLNSKHKNHDKIN